jgi:serine/threonine protein kinase
MDLKLSNTMLITDKTKKCGERAVLSDFGTAEIMTEIKGRAHSGFTGTVEFTAPEVLDENHEYSDFSEMWSLGIVAYALAYGNLPYTDSDPVVCAAKIRSHQAFKLPDFPERSEGLKLLILALTEKDVGRRPLAGALLTHPLIRAKISESYLAVD